ncbi:MAG: hypothetical protein EOO38_11520 [Cytophagaceae bacterium]|jgi:hypothetical protein|nr:MAG: hypothetical protein EOO38_11520 [Cytophagaceae bacterium]
MDINQVIAFLEASDGSVPKLNNQLALLIRYSRHEILDENDKKKVKWFDPEMNEITKVPDFTGSIDAARIFLDKLVHPHAAGYAERQDGIFAQVDEFPPAKATTIALAICIAALQAKRLQTAGR